MKAALVISHDRMSSCFSGVDLRLAEMDGSWGEGERISTRGWHPLAWGCELRRLGVTVLLCAGIDMATQSAVLGCGVEVIADALGDPQAVLAAWREGRLAPGPLWPPGPCGRGGGRRRRHRGGGRNGRHRRQ